MAPELPNQEDAHYFGSDIPQQGELYIMLKEEGKEDRKWFPIIAHCEDCYKGFAISQEAMSNYKFETKALPHGG